MLNNIFIYILTILYFLSGSRPSMADNADDLLKNLAKINSFSGNFQQILEDWKGVVLEKSSGKFSVQRPGYFRWQTTDPFPQLLVSNLQNIWLYDPDLKQVTTRTYNNEMSYTSALFLSNNVMDIKQQYTVKKQSIVNESKDQYFLTPIIDTDNLEDHKQQPFINLRIFFSNEKLIRISLEDSLNQTTTFIFTEAVYNQEIPKDSFEFIVPDKTDVIIGN